MPSCTCSESLHSGLKTVHRLPHNQREEWAASGNWPLVEECYKTSLPADTGPQLGVFTLLNEFSCVSKAQAQTLDCRSPAGCRWGSEPRRYEPGPASCCEPPGLAAPPTTQRSLTTTGPSRDKTRLHFSGKRQKWSLLLVHHSDRLPMMWMLKM